MLSDRFLAALGLSAILHLLVLQLPMAVGHHGAAGEARQADEIEVRLSPNPAPSPQDVDGVTPLPVPDMQTEQSAPDGGESSPQPGIPGPMHYFKSSEVDRRAEPVDVAPLIYPEAAYLRHIPGSVTLRVYINELGGVDAVDVVEAEPAGIFEPAAIDAVLKTRFLPAALFGRPVKNVKTLVIRFDPDFDRP